MEPKLAELSRKRGVLIEELNSDAVIADAKAYAAKEAEIDALEGEITRRKAALERSGHGGVFPLMGDSMQERAALGQELYG